MDLPLSPAAAEQDQAASRAESAEAAGSGTLAASLPSDWRAQLAPELAKPYFASLEQFLRDERAAAQVFPAADDLFSAFALTPYANVKVLVLGQDPYHDDGQAHGLSFSVRPGIRPPPSLVNIYKELVTDVGFRTPGHGSLVRWAEQGVLMLNAVLTVRAHQPASHKDRGWETFTDAVIRKVSEKQERVVFVLWGGYAKKKEKLIDAKKHVVLKGAHPSPLSARAGFFGSRPFSAINRALEEGGQAPIDWQL